MMNSVMEEVKQTPAATALSAREVADDEDDELQDLYRLLSKVSSRRGRAVESSTVTKKPTVSEATVTVGVLAKLSSQVENQNKANKARREQQAREAMTKELEAEATAAVRRANVAARQKQNSRAAVNDLIQRNRAKAQAMRSENAALGALRQRREDQYMQKAQGSVERMRGNDARLDALEEAAAETERQKASRERLERKGALESARTSLTAEKKQRAELLRLQTHRAVTLKVSEVAANKRRLALEAKAEVANWKVNRHREEQKRLGKAAVCRVQALTCHAGAATAREEMLRQRQEEAHQKMRLTRAQVANAVREREAVQHSNHTRCREQLASRTRSGAEAIISLANSASSHGTDLVGARDEAARDPLLTRGGLNLNREVVAANAALYRRIHHVSAVVDDDVSDEAAGAARATLAAESKARKATEAQKLAEENEVYEMLIASAVSKTDDGDGLQTGGQAVSDWRMGWW